MEKQPKVLTETKATIPEITYINCGRFTIANVKDLDGTSGVGLARRSQGDKPNDEIGRNIALNRALKAINKKRKGEKLHNPLMG